MRFGFKVWILRIVIAILHSEKEVENLARVGKE
jgi:hypothetical protein